MIQIFVLALALGLFIYDKTEAGAAPALHVAPLRVFCLLVLPKLALALLYALATRLAFRGLGGRRATQAMQGLDRVGWAYRCSTLALYGIDLRWGALDLLRGLIAPLFIVDKLFFVVPPILLVLWGWWCYYPIERRLREHSLLVKAQSGQPVPRIWTRGEFVLAQFRHQIAIVLVPILTLIAWKDLVNHLLWDSSDNLRALLAIAGGGCVFLFAPLMIRHIWDTVPLPPGPLREMLSDMCEQHKVKVRELLLWRTFGGMVNAAVMGFVGPVRFILLTDALLDSTSPAHVEAVMAHELAHVRRHHLFWLAVVALAAIGLFQSIWYLVFWGAVSCWNAMPAVQDSWLGAPVGWFLQPGYEDYAVGLGSAGLWILTIGWVSRRFERQADTYAVQHLAKRKSSNPPAEPWSPDASVDPESVTIMVGALQQVAELNHIPTAKKSWRHGSILWRQQYLETLVGLSVDRLPIDRSVFWIKVVAAAVFVVTLVT